MASWANVHQSAYLQSASLFRARRLLMHALNEPSGEAAKRFFHTDLNIELESLNRHPATPQEEAGQEASDELPHEYNWSAAAFSSVDYGYIVPPWCMVPTSLHSGLCPPACNLVYQDENHHHAHLPVV